MRVDKGPRTVAANEKPTSSKLLSASTKLVQNELPPGFPEARSFEDSSNQNEDDVRLPPVKAGKGSKTSIVNGKLASSKLALASTKLALGIGQDVSAKKVLTLKTG